MIPHRVCKRGAEFAFWHSVSPLAAQARLRLGGYDTVCQFWVGAAFDAGRSGVVSYLCSFGRGRPWIEGTIIRELIRGVKFLHDQEVERLGEAEMPRLMDKQDWKTVMSDVDTAENVWCENVVCDARNASYSLPGTGRFRVIFVKLDGGGEIAQTDMPRRRKLRISPEVRALRGVVSLDDKRDYKEILADSLQDKYESLS